MDKVVSFINDALENSKIEKTSNIIYQVKSKDPETKEELKKLLTQGNPIVSSTIVEIDFTNPPMSNKKQKIQKGIEIIKGEYNGSVLTLRIWNTPIYIYGEYIKLSREMSQTPLKIKGKFKTERSVSDFGNQIVEFFKADSFKFMGCGREDIDVRCLEGRPFIIEIANPTFNLSATAISLDLYEEIKIKNFHFATKECKDYVNCEDPVKFYNLLIFSKEKINFEKSYELKQKTPLRVLHRRADLIREKFIEILKFEELENDGFYYEVDIRASSGAYIKEWVNGDFNRTIPNLNADLLELDVITVDLNVDRSLFIRPIDINF